MSHTVHCMFYRDRRPSSRGSWELLERHLPGQARVSTPTIPGTRTLTGIQDLHTSSIT